MSGQVLEQIIEPFPNKKYNIIYADPPWKYNSRANHKTRFRGGACGHYQLLPMSQIRALPIPELADKNCALFMWCTFPYLNEQIKLFDYWGFKYRTCGFNWLKLNPKNGKPLYKIKHRSLLTWNKRASKASFKQGFAGNNSPQEGTFA